MSNLGAMFDSVFHPEISYLDEEHLMVGGITGIMMILLLGSLEMYLARREQAEAKLNESNERLQSAEAKISKTLLMLESIVSTNPDVIFSMGLNLNLILWNRTLEVVTGMATDALKNKPALELFAEEDRPSVLHSVRKCLEEGEGQVEARLINAQGSSTLFQFKGVLLKDEDGNVIGITGSGRDITERKRGEELLERLHQQNELILCSAAEGILGLDLQGKHTFVNPAAARMLGYEVEELLGRPSHSIWHHTKPDGSPYPEEECPIYTTCRNGAVHRVSTEVFWSKNGASFPVEYMSTPIHEQGRVAGAVLSFTDITDRKRSEATLKESEEKFRAIFEGSKDGIILVDEDSRRFLAGNKAFCDMVQYTLDEIRQLGILDVHPEEDVPWIFEEFDRRARQETEKEIDIPVKRKDGSIFWAEVKSSPVTISGKKYVFGSFRDITERRKAEEKIKESEDRYRDLVEHSQELICTHDLEGRLLSVNPWAARILGYAHDDLLRMKMSDLIAPEVRNEFHGYLEKIRKHGAAQGMLLVQTRNGERRIWEYKNTLRTEGVTEPVVRGMAQDITERKRSEEALIRLSMAVDQAAEAIVITDKEARIEYVNPSFERITGYLREEVVGQNMRILKSGKQDEMFYRNMWGTISRGEVWRGRFINRKKDGTLYDEESVISPVRNASGKIINFVAGKRDITQDIKLQKHVQNVQRMDSVGTLAGGIAHDFNNALTGIMGVAEILRLRIGENPDVSKNLDLLDSCARQAATLTRQLLTFARRQVIDPVNLDLNVVVTEMLKLMGKVIGEHIELETSLDKGLPTTKLDCGQVEQVIMNLCLNARDAMPSGGRLLLETADVTLDEKYVDIDPYMKPGRYARLTVSDTGIGMDKETLGKAFEPFFTTKPVGQGTGLGLSSVYGIVKQSGGFIHAYSEPGNGSSFKIYFPAVEAPPDVVTGKRREDAVRGGTEKILLAEDEGSLRVLAGRILTGLGYTVLVAAERRGGDRGIGTK